jgi:hypothetical protein
MCKACDDRTFARYTDEVGITIRGTIRDETGTRQESNAERRTPNAERRTPSAERRAPSAESQEPRMTDPSLPSVRAPEFPDSLDWIGTGGRPLRLADLRGRVTLLDFWTYG